MDFFTADICDEHREKVQVLAPDFKPYGGAKKCYGPIATLKLDDENTELISLLKEPGKGRVAVVDVSAAYYAVVGENLMKFARENNWAGIVINGYVRDTHITTTIDVGLWALGTCPRKSHDKKSGERDAELNFGGVSFKNNSYLYADRDGIIVTQENLFA